MTGARQGQGRAGGSRMSPVDSGRGRGRASRARAQGPTLERLPSLLRLKTGAEGRLSRVPSGSTLRLTRPQPRGACDREGRDPQTEVYPSYWLKCRWGEGGPPGPRGVRREGRGWARTGDA